MADSTTEPTVQDVSDTALWVACYRALESERPDALFRDPLAGRLAGERGRKIATVMRRPGALGWSIAIRTRIIDEYIERAVGEGTDAVLNLGAGLDTRPYRLKLPASLLWIEVDQPKIVQLKDEALRAESPSCRLERIALDLTLEAERRALFARIDAQARRVLVLTEGVVPYLSMEEAGSLADALRACERFQGWIVEYHNLAFIDRIRRRGGLEQKLRNAPLRFRPPDWEGFFTGHGWKVVETRYHLIEGRRLGRRLPVPWYVRALYPFLPRKRREAMQRMMGYSLLAPLR